MNGNGVFEFTPVLQTIITGAAISYTAQSGYTTAKILNILCIRLYT
jgi:hypothetical protein